MSVCNNLINQGYNGGCYLLILILRRHFLHHLSSSSTNISVVLCVLIFVCFYGGGGGVQYYILIGVVVYDRLSRRTTKSTITCLSRGTKPSRARLLRYFQTFWCIYIVCADMIFVCRN